MLRLVPETTRSVLDVGCGAGDNARLLTERGIQVDGVTLSIEEARIAGAYCRNVWVHDLEQGLPKGNLDRYDVIMCSHVLEHLCWPKTLLGDIRDTLSSEGCLVVAIPNVLFASNRWKLLTGTFEYEEEGLMDRTHFRFYTCISIARLLESCGFQVMDIRGDGHFPMPAVRRVLGPVGRIIDRVAARIWPGLFGLQIVIIAKVK